MKSKKSGKGQNRYDCLNGEKVSQATIDKRRAESHRLFLIEQPHPVCGGCGEPANDFDHTIAQARCKVIHRTELIWDTRNQVPSCRKCHGEWEAFKSGEYLEHDNVHERMMFLKTHDPEGYTFRVELTNFDPHGKFAA